VTWDRYELDLLRLRPEVARLRPVEVPLRFDEDDVERFPDDRFAVLLLADFRDAVRFVELAGDFLAVLFLPVFFAVVFLLGDRLLEDFAADRFFDALDEALFAFCRCSRASAVPPIAAPRAAAPVAASAGFSATALATFLAPLPTADAAPPAFSAAFEITERPSSFMSSIRSARVARLMTPPRTRRLAPRR